MPNLIEQTVNDDGSLYLKGTNGVEFTLQPATVLSWFNGYSGADDVKYDYTCRKIYRTIEDTLGEETISRSKIVVTFDMLTGRMYTCLVVD